MKIGTTSIRLAPGVYLRIGHYAPPYGEQSQNEQQARQQRVVLGQAQPKEQNKPMNDDPNSDGLLQQLRQAIFAARDGGVSAEEIEDTINIALDDLDNPLIAG